MQNAIHEVGSYRAFVETASFSKWLNWFASHEPVRAVVTLHGLLMYCLNLKKLDQCVMMESFPMYVSVIYTGFHLSNTEYNNKDRLDSPNYHPGKHVWDLLKCKKDREKPLWPFNASGLPPIWTSKTWESTICHRINNLNLWALYLKSNIGDLHIIIKLYDTHHKTSHLMTNLKKCTHFN